MEREVILAVDIGGSKYVAGLVAADGTVICKEKYCWSRMSAEQVTADIISAMEWVIEEHPGVKISAVGMTIPGLADPETGMWISASFMGIYNLPIGGIIGRRFGLPVYIENDCNACALAERMFGHCREIGDFLYLTVSNSIGGALFLNGELYRGFKGNAGEVGLIHVDVGNGPAGPVRMAVEDCASGRGLAEGYLALKEKGESWEVRNAPDGVSIARLAKEGDPVAREAFRREGIYLGQAIAACCAVLDPEVVIIGGGLSLAFEHYQDALCGVLARELHIAAGEVPPVRPTALGYDGGLIGAAALAVRGMKK
ncbi:ROK family protein [Clostridium sp. AF18-27]|uniref:ROK family protein n=1 Tax=Enterocloster lavalensis TaxID=460384 RepID=UPI000E5061C9|nr:ROK family protein [Enterocloster lavalensis]RHR53981.1 ROK family protein [Clostridium sp. AF18-27]